MFPCMPESTLSTTGLLTKEFLQDLSIIQIFSQVLYNDSLSHKNVVYPINQHLDRESMCSLNQRYVK